MRLRRPVMGVVRFGGGMRAATIHSYFAFERRDDGARSHRQERQGALASAG
jgi:hypothetical protein